MSINQSLIAELKSEAANTRKMLERIPENLFDYKPHEKSMLLGRLAQHVAELPSWLTMTVKTEYLDFQESKWTPEPLTTTEALVAFHDKNVAEAIKALEETADADFMVEWTLRSGDHVILKLPRVAVCRSMVMNHMIHHRGQLSVYLRLNNVPLPGIYGPTADEHPMAAPVSSEATA